MSKAFNAAFHRIVQRPRPRPVGSRPISAIQSSGADDLQNLAVVLAMLGQEFSRGDEHGAGQAGVGMWAGLLYWQSAEPVGQRLRGSAEALFSPRGLG